MTTLDDHDPTVASTATGGRAWLICVLLTILYLINFLDKSIAGLAAGPIMAQLKIGPAQFGLLNSAFYLLFIPLQLLGGVVADRWSSKRILLVMALIWSLAAMPVAASASFAALLVSRMTLGAGEGPTSPVAVHSLYKWFAPTRRAIPHALLTTGGPLSIVVGAPILLWTVSHCGWRASVLGLGVLSLLWAGAWIVLGAEGPLDDARGRRTWGQDRLSGYAGLVGTGTFTGCVLVGFASYFALTLMFTWLPHYLESALHLRTGRIGGIISLAWVVVGLGPFPVGMVSQALLARGVSTRLAQGMMTASILALAGALMVAGTLAPVTGAVGAALLVAGLALAVVPSPVMFTVLGRFCPIHLRGGLLGIFGACIVSAGIFAPTLMGYAIQGGATQQAGYATGFFWFGLFALLGGVAGLVLINPERDGRSASGAQMGGAPDLTP